MGSGLGLGLGLGLEHLVVPRLGRLSEVLRRCRGRCRSLRRSHRRYARRYALLRGGGMAAAEATLCLPLRLRLRLRLRLLRWRVGRRLSKARLKRVSSRPAWGQLVRGSRALCGLRCKWSIR